MLCEKNDCEYKGNMNDERYFASYDAKNALPDEERKAALHREKSVYREYTDSDSSSSDQRGYSSDDDCFIHPIASAFLQQLQQKESSSSESESEDEKVKTAPSKDSARETFRRLQPTATRSNTKPVAKRTKSHVPPKYVYKVAQKDDFEAFLGEALNTPLLDVERESLEKLENELQEMFDSDFDIFFDEDSNNIVNPVKPKIIIDNIISTATATPTRNTYYNNKSSNIATISPLKGVIELTPTNNEVYINIDNNKT